MIGERRQFLQRYFDPSLEIPSGLTREDLETGEIERISTALSIILLAGDHPRRLGGDASDEDLALDKKRARRAGHALGQALRGWTKKKPTLPVTPELRSSAATLDFPRWFEAHQVLIKTRLCLLATWAVINEEERWGRSAVVKLENELNWISYAARD